MRWSQGEAMLRVAFAATLLVAIGTLGANAADPGVPAGVYLHVDIEHLLHDAGKEHARQTDRDSFIRSKLAALLNSPVLAGITVGLRWNTLEPKAPTECKAIAPCPPDATGFTWNDLDDVFAVVKGMPDKTVQLIITPGFDAPQWLKDRLKPCDALFANGKADWDCGSTDFIDFPEQGRANRDDGSKKSGGPRFTLPLPWSADYQEAWRRFLEALSEHVQNEPQLVAIQIAGPIGASDEMILPTTLNGPDSKSSEHSMTRVGHIAADTAWTTLIENYDRNPDSTKHYGTTSDDIFVAAWKTAIDDYAKLFPKLTLILSPDAGNDMPTYGLTSVTPHADNFLYGVDCSLAAKGGHSVVVPCEAKTEIISYFLKQWASLKKGTEVGGLTASSQEQVGDIGVPGTKILTATMPGRQWTQQLAIAGAQFDHPASNLKDNEGCTSKGGADCPKDIEQAAADVLKNLFYDTQAAAKFGNDQNGVRTINYVDIPAQDVEYMTAHGCKAPQGERSMLQQIADANVAMRAMAGAPRVPKVDLCTLPVKLPSVTNTGVRPK